MADLERRYPGIHVGLAALNVWLAALNMVVVADKVGARRVDSQRGCGCSATG